MALDIRHAKADENDKGPHLLETTTSPPPFFGTFAYHTYKGLNCCFNTL